MHHLLCFDDAGVRLDEAWFAARVPDGVSGPPRVDDGAVVFGRMATLVPVALPIGAGDEMRVMVKRIVPAELAEKGRSETFLASARREVSFFAAMLRQGRSDPLFPRVFAAEEHRTAHGDSVFLLAMQDATSVGCAHLHRLREVGPLQRALASLAALASGRRLLECEARFRARSAVGGRAPAESTALALAAAAAPDEERGGFWVLSRRPADEVEGAAANWAAFCERFDGVLRAAADGGLDRARLRSLGPKLAALAPALDARVRSHCVVAIHGDAKSWNLFFPPADRPQDPVQLIDMQWVGLGHPVQDLAYLLTTSADAALLRQPGTWQSCARFLRAQLRASLDAAGVADEGFRKRLLCSDAEAFAALADVAWLDYARVVLLGLWRRLTPEGQRQRAGASGVSLATTSLPQMEYVLARAADLVDAAEVRRLE